MNQTEIKRRQAQEAASLLTLITILVMGHLLGEGGVTYVTVAALACALVWTAVAGSLSDALGRILRGRRNKGQYKNILGIRKNVMLFQMVLGVLGSAALFVFAGNIAEGIFHIPYSTFILQVLSPIVFLRTLVSVFLGYFQGEGSELPRAVSCILRQVFILAFGILFGNLLGSYGEKVSGLLKQEQFTPMYGGAGLALAVCLAEAFVLLFLMVIFKGSRRSERKMKQEGMYASDSLWDCIRMLCAGRWPQFFTGILAILPLILGIFLARRMVPEEGFLAGEYGLYVGKYLAVCGIFAALISMMGLPVLGKVFQCFKREEGRFARAAFQGGVHFCLAQGIFLSVYAGVMGAQISGLLCGENGETVKQMFYGGSSVILFFSLGCYFGRFLQASGRKYFVLGAAAAADICFVVIAMVMPGAGLLALVYGGLAGSFVFCIVLGVFSYRQLRLRADWLGVLIVPLGAGVAAGLVCMLFGRLMAPLMGDLAALVLAFVVAGGVFWTVLLLLRNFKEQELEVVPGGRLMGALGQKLHIY